jgi:cobalt-zinc-cadmium efflux system outer membrane protein
MSYHRGIAALTALLCSIGVARAAEPLQLNDLIAIALTHNPEVMAAQKRYEAARQRPAQARTLPDPVLSAGYASNGGPLPGQGLGRDATSNIGVMISQQLPYPGKLGLRAGIAGKEADAELQQFIAVQWKLRSKVSEAYHRLHHAYAALELLARARELTTQTLRISEVRYSLGKTPQQDIFRTQTEISMIETRVVEMEQDKQTAEAEINYLLDRKPDTPVGEPVMADAPPLLTTMEELLRRADELSPELRGAQKTIERGELAVNLARRDFHPDYTVAAGYFNQGGMAPMFQVRVDIPLRIHQEQRERPALNAEVDRLSEVRRDYEATAQSLQFRIRESYIAAQTAWRVIQLYSDTILPQNDLTVESSMNAYQNGTGDFAPVLTSLTAKIDAEERVHEQELNYLLALTRLEELTGARLLQKGEAK